MKSNFSGTVFGGGVQLDEPVELADASRVHVTIIPVDQWKGRWSQVLSTLEELRVSHPIRSGRLKYTREQLHERS
jgi:antitoxin (DNA-binding transcriptional repressor) of toxin-antitoxin stability system